MRPGVNGFVLIHNVDWSKIESRELRVKEGGWCRYERAWRVCQKSQERAVAVGEWKNQKGETHGIYYGLKIGDSEGGWVHEVVGPGVFRTCYSSKA